MYREGIDASGTRNQRILNSLPAGALALSLVYAFLVIQGFLPNVENPRFLTSTRTFTAVVLAAIALVTRFKRPSSDLAHPIAFLVAVVLLGQISIEGVYTSSPVAVAALPLAVLGSGLVMYSGTWVAAVGIVAVAFRITGDLGGASGIDTAEAARLVIASVMAVAASAIRRRAHREWIFLLAQTRRQEQELEESRQRFALSMAGCNDGLYDWDHTNDEVYYSPRWKEILGYEEDEIEATADASWSRIHEDDIGRVRDAMVAHFRGDVEHFEQEFRILHKRGHYVWVLARGASIRDDNGRVRRMAGSMTDMSSRGVFDPLTGLPNRRLLADRMTRALDHQDRGNQDCALLFIDLDRFKLVNDTLGHHAGDEVLVEVSARLQTCVRASDTVSRLGGDEFVVLLERVDLPEGAYITINRILSRLADPIHLEGQDIYPTASLGAVLDTRGYNDPSELLRDADTAMYQAKSRNRGWAVFDSSMREQVADRLRVETELRQALERGEFELAYQPIVSLADGETEGFEALVRWNHPRKGQIQPGDFIPVMEDTGLVVELGRWVLRQACQEMQDKFGHLDPARRPSVAVNVSRRQLTDRGLAKEVEDVLCETGFPPELLRIEITETAIIEHADRALDTLKRIKALGVELVMDDFGTGHSSLGALQALPIDTLKIDRTFIQQLSTTPDGIEVVRTIIAMASNLKLKVIAEGIESEEQLDQLQTSQCESGQGYLLARPAPLADYDPEKSKLRAQPQSKVPVP